MHTHTHIFPTHIPLTLPVRAHETVNTTTTSCHNKKPSDTEYALQVHMYTHTEDIENNVTSHTALYFQTWLHVIIIIGSGGSASAKLGQFVVTDGRVRFKGHSHCSLSLTLHPRPR